MTVFSSCQLYLLQTIKIHLLTFFLRLYSFVRDTEREVETQTEGEAGSPRGARCGTWSQDPGVTTWAKGRCSTTEPPRCPYIWIFLFQFKTFSLTALYQKKVGPFNPLFLPSFQIPYPQCLQNLTSVAQNVTRNLPPLGRKSLTAQSDHLRDGKLVLAGAMLLFPSQWKGNGFAHFCSHPELL